MSRLKTVCRRIEEAGRHPRMPNRLACERAAAKIDSLATAPRREREPWDGFITRIRDTPPNDLRVRDLSRLTRELWDHDNLAEQAASILDQSIAKERKSLDRAIVHSYLAHFPKEHRGFRSLTAASALVARRHDWPWAARGRQFRLWSPTDGPNKVAAALLDSEQPEVVLRDAGLDGDLASGQFALEAITKACLAAMNLRGKKAEAVGGRLIGMLDRLKGITDLEGLFAYALLRPWNAEAPAQAYQQTLIATLCARNGDPRLASARWAALLTGLRQWVRQEEAEVAFGNLRRWLVQATVREFFSIVAKTTDRADQWKERTDFWLSYLDAGHISDAWFALGHMAEREAGRFLQKENLQFGRISGQGADSSHSTLIMTLGDLRIAEWSHNGRCRFWPQHHRTAPKLYQKEYFALVLRTMDAQPGLDPLAHHNNWQYKFARRIYDNTGIAHPTFGAGW